MLCLSVKRGEFIQITYAGRVIRVFPEKLTGDKVRLAVDAPEEIKVLRSEHVKKEAEDRE